MSTYDFDKEERAFIAIQTAIRDFGDAIVSLNLVISGMRHNTERLLERIGALEEQIEGKNELVFTREQIVSIIHDTVDSNYFDDNFADAVDEKIESHTNYSEHLSKDDITEIFDDYLSDLRIERR